MSLRSIPEQGAIVSPEQLSTLLDSASDLTLFLDPSGNIQFVSTGITRLLGHSTSDLIGNSLLSLLHEQDADGITDELAEVSASGREALGRRCRLRSLGGGYRWFEASVRDCTNISGIGALVLHFQDVTELQRMEAERQVI